MNAVAGKFLPLGLVSFGGPSGQVGLFERLFVEKFRVTSPETFAEQLSLCTLLPGSTSLQMAMALGTSLSGSVWGGLLGVLLFSLPGLALMLLVGKYASSFGASASGLAQLVRAEWIYAAAVSVLVVASLTLFQRICKTTLAVVITVLAAAITLSVPFTFIPLVPLGAALLSALLTPQSTVLSLGLGARLVQHQHQQQRGAAGEGTAAEGTAASGFSMTGAQVSLGVLALLSLGAYFLGAESKLTQFFLAGASLAGGGTAVLPFLRDAMQDCAQTEASGLFLQLFSLAMVSPGPIYNLAAAVGVAMSGSLWFGLAAWLAVVLPGILLLNIVMPTWMTLKKSYEPLNRAILGLNAAAVGVLVAGTVQLYLETIGLQWTRIFALLIAVALQAVWELEPVFVVLLGFATALLHGLLLL